MEFIKSLSTVKCLEDDEKEQNYLKISTLRNGVSMASNKFFLEDDLTCFFVLFSRSVNNKPKQNIICEKGKKSKLLILCVTNYYLIIEYRLIFSVKN